MTTRSRATPHLEPGRARQRGRLARYVIAATPARVSDGGAIVAVVLLVHTAGGSPPGSSRESGGLRSRVRGERRVFTYARNAA
jgi:hypothetical protein